ncbi:DALR anticodon-binding domain-containing protein [Streptomyces sp. WMMB 322]|uniref:DALR anticodon-binding domain-containing protein n=1 Tax=Streptomyces sp. WMMB 322 TaxID=1286821 RepID=UPI0006E37DEE|nr:DALR anticodon-binding domain-containing protein [Streptomyces sp. WMMB 322]SCK59352.1 arginyl-tRNA synthetase [Streptomyces sp. WMMB 322]
MTPAQLSRTVLHAVHRAAADGELGAVRGSTGLPQRVTVESPPRRGSGDYALNVAFALAGPAAMTPHDVARVVQPRLLREDGVDAVEIAGGGFLNVTLDAGARAGLVAELSRPSVALAGGPEHGSESRSRPGNGTGPVTSVQDDPAADIARWSAVTGDAPAVLAVRTAQASALFRVQYAHARARALSRNAGELGFRADPEAAGEAGPAYGPSGGALLALLADHRRVSEQSAPARHARHLVAVGEAFFDFHDQHPPLPRGDEKPGAVHRARLALVEATGTVLAGGLTQLGVSAPAHL